MAYSVVQYTADGNTETYTVPFPYLNQEHVQVYINGIEQLHPSNYNWTTNGAIQFNGNVISGALIELKRVTPATPLVTYQNGSVLTSDDLNTAALQNLYVSQELLDQMDVFLGTAATKFTSGGVVSMPVDPETLIQAAAQQILNSDLLTQLQSYYNDTDNNGQTLLDHSNKLGWLGGLNAGGTAFVLNQNTTYIDDSTTLADYISQTAAALGSNTSAITAEQTARADGDSANATAITNLTTTVNGNTSSIETQATTVDGLSAQYTVKVDVNGYVSGYGLASTAVDGTPASEFIVLADKFAVVTPGNPSVVPFSIVGGVVYMQNVVINDALINSLTITKLTQGALNADMNLGTGKIVWTNGAYMKVTGVGFGSSNQFLEWFGPYNANYATCTETNAVSYLKVNGSAYFGGTLLAGKLVNSAQGTVLDTTNTATIGPFSSNGGIITVTFSWNYSWTENFPAGTGSAYDTEYAKGAPTGTAVLSLSLSGGAAVDVATMNLTGTISGRRPTSLDNGNIGRNMAGSSTYTDNNQNLDTRTYKLRITALNPAIGGGVVENNTLAVQSVE